MRVNDLPGASGRKLNRFQSCEELKGWAREPAEGKQTLKLAQRLQASYRQQPGAGTAGSPACFAPRKQSQLWQSEGVFIYTF